MPSTPEAKLALFVAYTLEKPMLSVTHVKEVKLYVILVVMLKPT